MSPRLLLAALIVQTACALPTSAAAPVGLLLQPAADTTQPDPALVDPVPLNGDVEPTVDIAPREEAVEARPQQPLDVPSEGEFPIWWVIGGAIGLVLATAAGVTAWQRRESDAPRPTRDYGSGFGSPPPPPDSAPRPAAHAVPEGRSTRELTARVEELERKTEWLKHNLDRVMEHLSQPTAAAHVPAPHPAPMSPPALPPPVPPLASTAFSPSSPAVPETTAQAVGSAFTAWCNERGPMAGEREPFARALAERVPGATVRSIQRDLDSTAHTPRFDGHGGQSPAEYWLVQAGTDLFVLPHPQSAQQFRDTAGVYEGSAQPAQLRTLTPARVRPDGAAFELTQSGTLA